MLYNYKISRAIRFSTKVHEVYQKQKRKGKDIPYITHPITVGLILSRAGADEDTVVAGILHDSIEDSIADKKVSRDMLVEHFGEEVATIVESVTEPNKKLPWEERKKEALARIQHFSHQSLLVKSADIISNTTELIEDYEQDGEAVFERFNAPKEKLLEHYLRTITLIIERWPDNPLVEDLRWVARELQTIGQLQFMQQHHATIIEYAHYNENMPLQCPICGWRGTPKESGWINTDSHYCMDVSCPNCEKMLLVVNYPLAKSATSDDTQKDKVAQRTSPKKLLIPLSLSPEEALRSVKKHLGIGKESDKKIDNGSKDEIVETEIVFQPKYRPNSNKTNRSSMKKPTQCHLWQKENLDPSDLEFELVKTFIESSHFDRNILKCKKCGQLYFHEFYEHINFGGDDDMYDTWIPVYDEEDIKIVSEAETPTDLLQFSPRLHWALSGGKEEPMHWIGK